MQNIIFIVFLATKDDETLTQYPKLKDKAEIIDDYSKGELCSGTLSLHREDCLAFMVWFGFLSVEFRGCNFSEG